MIDKEFKKGFEKALGNVFEIARTNPTIQLRFNKSTLDTIERLEKEDRPSLLSRESTVKET